MTLRLAYRMPGAVRPLVQSALVQRELFYYLFIYLFIFILFFCSYNVSGSKCENRRPNSELNPIRNLTP
tara:strand:- start:159 stop:365 length:207 start_codon:yes stop_codon:yes gene_type:complete